MSLGTRINGYFREGSERARRLILLRPSRSLPRGVLVGPRRVIDPESGQVSHETTSRELQVSDYHWDFQFEELLEEQWEDSDDGEPITVEEAIISSTRRRKPGVPRLIQLAVASIVKNVADITYENIQYMAPLHLEFIWRELTKRCVNSFNTWKAFSKVLGRQRGAILNQFRYSNAITEPIPSLSVYTKPLTSATFDYLVHLSITTAFSTSDLVELSTLTNLVALEVINPKQDNHLKNTGKLFDSSFGDRVIKTWSESAIESKGFQVLRILKLRNFKEITNNCFQYLNGFPVLAVFDVLDCGFEGLAQLGAEAFGWEVHPDGAFLEILQSACVKHSMALRTTLGLPVRPVRRSAAKPLYEKAKITMIPRADVPAFLAGDRASSSTAARNSAYVDAEERVTRLEQTPSGRARLARMGFSHFEAVDYMSRRAVRELETWEFRTYTALNRISELRNDEDLRAAGIDVGDSVPLVSGEVISAVPVASVRLGPELLYPLARGQLHQPFYDGGVADRSLKFTSRDLGVNAKGYVYTRIKVATARTRTREQAEGEAEGAGEGGGEAEDEAGREAGREARGSGSRQSKRRKVRGEKRQQLGDLLAGVMGVI
ncbi:hypothetical protein SBOR_6708 [Sclerotinia borealis F-4128]|uniref:Cbs domain-containing protein n=1 Tax=Sclerotinia borealis (strain F-4128) TaxID=1432307 RepID=W9CDM0_SCLBF|nr:hypothetical protein SBOR_6708 [Sclerotinia borealis F-4128]